MQSWASEKGKTKKREKKSGKSNDNFSNNTKESLMAIISAFFFPFLVSSICSFVNPIYQKKAEKRKKMSFLLLPPTVSRCWAGKEMEIYPISTLKDCWASEEINFVLSYQLHFKLWKLYYFLFWDCHDKFISDETDDVDPLMKWASSRYFQNAN